jgi:SAM-dependent methyltransferase
MSSDLSAQYERQERWRHWAEALTRIPLKAGQRILDLGCGVGLIAARFHRLGAQVIGVDGSEELLAAARRCYPEVRFEQLDLGQLTPASFGQAWRLRLQRMAGLKVFLGARFPEFERTFLPALAAPNHRSQTRVFIVVAQRPSCQGAALPIDIGTKQAGV